VLVAAAEGGSNLGAALITAGGVVVTAVCALVGVLVSNRRRGRSSSGDENLVVNLATALSDERDKRLAVERERDNLSVRLDACIERERRRRR
jgi:hypothetical protein